MPSFSLTTQSPNPDHADNQNAQIEVYGHGGIDCIGLNYDFYLISDAARPTAIDVGLHTVYLELGDATHGTILIPENKIDNNKIYQLKVWKEVSYVVRGKVVKTTVEASCHIDTRPA